MLENKACNFRSEFLNVTLLCFKAIIASCLAGEYITIYQYQRQQQKLRLQEKEAELEALNRDRADLRGQLARLEEMVRNFVAKEAGIHASTTKAHYINGGTSDPGVEQSDKSSAVSSQVKPSGKIHKVTFILHWSVTIFLISCSFQFIFIYHES